MSTEYGIFGDEGKLEGDFYSREEAERALADRYSAEDGEHVGECCHDHPDHEAATCEECNADDDGEDEEAGDDE